MALCPNCGASVENGAIFCTSCGSSIHTNDGAPETPATPVNEEVVYNTPQTAPKARELNVAQLVWAIINIVLCCMPLGVAGLVFTIMAKDSPDDATEAKRLKNAKIFNIIATVGGALIVVFYIIYFVFLFSFSEYMYY